MSDRFRRVLAVSLAVALAASLLGLTACAKTEEGGGEGGGEEVMKGGTFKFYINEPAFIDPYNGQESEGVQVIQAVFDSLVQFDPITGEIMPAAADSWEANDDASVWTFHLNEDATFHDGTPVTAADFKYAWERIANPETESEIAYHLAPVKGFDAMQAGEATELEGVTAVDDYTLQVELTAPMADFQYVVGHPALAPVPKDLVENGVEYNGETVDYSEMPVGNGPFMLTEPWAHDQYIKVAAYDGYYGDMPNIDGIDFLIFKDEETAFLEFEAGNLDFTSIPTERFADTKATYGESPDGYTANPGEQVLTGAETAIYYMLINNNDPLLGENKALRQALSLAIDRQEISDKIFEGTRDPAVGVVPPGIVGYEGADWPYSKYDPDEAARLLEEAGFPNGEGLDPIKIQFNSGSGHEEIMELIQEDLAALGIESELEGFEWAQYLDLLFTDASYQIARLGWIADYPTLDNFTYPLFYSTSSDNYCFYNNPEVDEALDNARTIVDDDERIAEYQRIQKMIGEDVPVIPIMYYKHGRVASDRVHDGVFSPMGLFDFQNVWLSEAQAAE
ncbi:MAG: ABC transporter substrate-binding protein [Coriobacteriia bacterium]